VTFRNIMVPFQAADTGGRGFNAGAVLAKHFKAHLDVVHIKRKIPLPAGYYYPVAGARFEEITSAEAAGADRLASELRAQFENLCQDRAVGRLQKAQHDQSMGATAAWTELSSNYSFDFAYRARLADLAVVGKPAGEPTAQAALVEELIFQSGRPVLIDAAIGGLVDFPKTIIVAWDGGREAARALSMTLPMLKQAESVIVTSIGDIKNACESAERAAAYLRLHDVHALHNFPGVRKGQSPEERLLEHAENKKANMIVMGAYSHNRWREVVMGGFTRHILNHADLPVVLAH